MKNRFQDGGHGLLGFSIGTILAMNDLQVMPMPPTKSQVNWLSVQEKNRRNLAAMAIVAIAAILDFPRKLF